MKITIFENKQFYLLQGYEGLYSVSKDGFILSHEKEMPNGGIKAKRILKPSLSKSGYLTVRLSKNGVGITKTLHRLVLSNFIDNIDNLPQINHKDGNKLNNKIDNLEWCSASHNTKHAWQNSLIVPSEKFKERASRQFIKNLADKQRKLNNEIADNIIEIYNNKNISMKKLGALFNVSSQTVCNIIHGKRYLV